MAKLASARPVVAAPDIGAWLAARVWPVARAAAIPASIVLLALLLRVIRLELQAWTPDTYEHMTAAHRLVSGEFPISRFYPPGVAITLAPAFVLFPQTLATQQGVIIASALVLVLVAYYGARAATTDRAAPVLLALAVAAAPPMVFYSRDGFFDVTNAAWITGAIFMVPWLRGRSSAACIAYGLLLAVAISVRATNPAFLPALVIFWTDAGRIGLHPRALWRATVRREPIAAGIAMVAAFAAFSYFAAALPSAAARAPITFEHAGRNIIYYAVSEFGGPIPAPFVLLLAVLGSTYLWRRNRTLLYVSLYMLIVFPLAHVPLPFANVRYMLPSFVFALLLAAYAPAAIRSLTERHPPLQRNAWRAIVYGAIALVAVYCVAADAAFIAKWPSRAARSDEAAYRQLRPIVAALPPGSLVVSGGTRGVRDSNRRIEYLDLIDYSLATDNGPQRVDEIMQRIREALRDGRPAYYLYTSVEGIDLTFTTDGPGYQPYFDTASDRFHLTDVYDTDVEFFTLYAIESER